MQCTPEGSLSACNVGDKIDRCINVIYVVHTLEHSISIVVSQGGDRRMATKRGVNSDTRKNVASTPSTVNRLVLMFKTLLAYRGTPKPHQTSTDKGENYFYQDTTTASLTEISTTSLLPEAEQLMFQALKQLQEIYDDSCKIKPNKNTIERTTFEKIATAFQQAFEQIKTTKAPMPSPVSKNMNILDALQ